MHVSGLVKFIPELRKKPTLRVKDLTKVTQLYAAAQEPKLWSDRSFFTYLSRENGNSFETGMQTFTM